MAFFQNYFKKQRITYDLSTHKDGTYNLIMKLSIPKDIFSEGIEKLNRLKGTNVKLLDKFNADERLREQLAHKISGIVKDIEKEVCKDKGMSYFTISSIKLEDVSYISKNSLTEVTLFVKGVCFA